MLKPQVTVVGGGLAGSEAALQLAARGVQVRLYEMRPGKQTEVHKTGLLAELVCSNSLKSTNSDSAAGALKTELEAMGSFLMAAAKKHAVAAGGALAVNRKDFSREVESLVAANPNIELIHEEVTELPEGPAIIATGPLTSEALTQRILKATGSEHLAFYDAAAPIVEAASLDRSVIFLQSRYDKGDTADYLNAPMNREEYEAFITELLAAERVIDKHFKRSELFAACQPVEEVARTGLDALRHGALKPVGLQDPRTGRRPWAVVQLRAENSACTAYNLVGFQTNLKFGEQKRVFSMIPGLQNAEFSRFGVMHRNTFVDTPHCLTPTLALPAKPQVHLAGQLTGTEGYVEAIASGLFAALAVFAELTQAPTPQLPAETLFGSLLAYATNPATQDYQPMHVNYGIMEPLVPPVKRKGERYAAYAVRAKAAIEHFVATRSDLFATGA